MSDLIQRERELTALRSSLPLGLSSLSSRVFWSVIPVILILSIILGAANVYEYRRLITEEFMKRGASMASNLAYSSELGVFSEDQQLLEASLRGVLRDPDTAYVAIYGDGGKLLAWRKLGSGSAEERGLSPEDRNRLAAEQKAFLNTSASVGNDLIEFLAPVSSELSESSDQVLLAGAGNNDGRAMPGQVVGAVPLGAVRLGLSLDSLNQQTQTLILIWTLLTAGMLLLSGMAIYTLSRRITMPVMRLTEQARRIAHGILDETIEIRSADEIGQLATSFNQMVQSLKTTTGQKEHVFRELQELNRTLEDRIHERTIELEAREVELKAASRHKSDFLANMSHELRTPLNAILGFTQLILDDLYGEVPTALRDPLERMRSNGRHLLNLVNDVLDLSKIEAGQMSLSEGDYSLADVVQTVFITVEPLASAKRLKLTVDMPSNFPPAKGDERRIAQALLNLVGNAIKFTDAGEVAIKAVAAEKFFVVSVRDTGPGISANDQAKIFEKFQQADNLTTRKQGGAGLGLAIAKRFIEMHGGCISVESTVGEGSTFSFTLPATNHAQAGRHAEMHSGS
jgi:signal transduction histidine kinase